MSIFENAQWVVDADGMMPVDSLPPYEIDIERVHETTSRGGRVFYDWPLHMAEKTWVDAGLFNEAFNHAIRHHARTTGAPIDEAMLSASFEEAIRLSNE